MESHLTDGGGELPFAAYYTVRWTHRAAGSLGLDAQRAAVAAFVTGRGQLVGEFVEIESRRGDRPQLAAALALCRRQPATLVIARLSLLTRSISFIPALAASGVEFVACDVPEADRATLAVLAAVAKHERELASTRTVAALAAAKARGVRLGNPRPDLTRAREAAAAEAVAFRTSVAPHVLALRAEGKSLAQIAAILNQRGMMAARGGHWHKSSVARILRLVEDERRDDYLG